mmetsp:Transcript_3599/g.7179  ORF Transcript_3599/g.7179 Transcript_3599/m.7179 type:complete len:1732 (-) Transcript_3599:138-5333(-)
MEQDRRVSFVANDLFDGEGRVCETNPANNTTHSHNQHHHHHHHGSFPQDYLAAQDGSDGHSLRSSSIMRESLQTAISRSSSLDLRKRPPEILLVGDIPDSESCLDDTGVGLDDDKRHSMARPKGIMNRMCLNARFELRTQLLLSFGSLSFLSISFVVITCILTGIIVGKNVKGVNREKIGEMNQKLQGIRARYLVESLDHRLFPRDSVEILYQATLDRFAGYPSETDEKLPFRNENGQGVYPLVGPLPLLDSSIERQVTEENFREHVQTRKDWYGGTPVSTATAMFHIQGNCNISETDPLSPTYHSPCTEANNDIRTGGIVNPSNKTELIHRKGADLVPLLKALYEYNQDVRDLGIYFGNDGSGAVINYPAFSLQGSNSYVSIGCDWLNERNPYDPSRTIGTPDMIQKCVTNGTLAFSRTYNPLERKWFRDLALNPEKVVMEGPSLDAFLSGAWLLNLGRAVYDRFTKNFIGCVYVGLQVDFLESILRKSRVSKHSEVSIVRIDQGAVVASSAWNITKQGTPPLIHELNVGVTQTAFEYFKNLVDFDSKWDPVEVRRIFESQYALSEDRFLVSHPFPPVPAKYDAKYRPDFLAIISTPISDVFEAVEDTNKGVDTRVENIAIFSVIAGCSAVLLATFGLLIVSNAITSPLRYMNDTAQRIVNSFGDNSPEAKEFPTPVQPFLGITFNTEITQLVQEFKKMVSSFSGGSLMARAENAKYVEIANHFPLRTVFADLYNNRGSSSEPAFTTKPSSEALQDPINCGSLLTVKPDFVDMPKLRPKINRKNRFGSHLTSPLFLWTVVLIVIPLLLTMITIAVVSTTALIQEFDDTIHESEAFLLRVKIKNLQVSTDLKAAFASRQASRSIRDLYLMTRYAGWLLFGGLGLPDSATAVQNLIDQCKAHDDPTDCPDSSVYQACDCKWQDKPEECRIFPDESRHLLKPFIIVQSDSALPNGTRWGTRFPDICVSPNTTEWWRTEKIPGRANASTSSLRYATSFDRARAISATSPVLLAINDYSLRWEHGIGQYFGFEDDGLLVGSNGCYSALNHIGFASFRSTEANGAADISPELCPLGRYGFDPRCRDWYNSAKKKVRDLGIPLHVTAPYTFAGDSQIAQSATSPLIDPATEYYVGQTLYDFSIDKILSSLEPDKAPHHFPLLITPEADNFGGDVVIGPGLDAKISEALSVAGAIIPEDLKCSKDGAPECLRRKDAFDDITNKMKSCAKGTARFERRKADGGTETIFLSYAPVRTPFLEPLNPAEFTSGAYLKNYSCIYSLALVESEDGMQQPFREVEEKLYDQTRIAIICLAFLIFVAFVFALLISHRVARSITEPMVYLLETIRSLEKKGIDQELPQLDMNRGSKEILNVSNTMESLYEVVQFANVAFYAGELEVAYRVLKDSLRIFRGMGNNKAVSVTCNNLGNIVLAIFIDMKHEECDVKFGLTRKEIIAFGTAYYHEAIMMGEAAYDEFHEKEGWTPNCLDFMQHLSNRYFNRAMFLLTVKDDHSQPLEIERLGIRDLGISRDMDVEIIDQGEEVGWGRINRSEKLFQVGLTRIRGLILLLEMGYPDEWNIQGKLDELLDIMNAEATKDHSNLFREIGYVGRLQQVETELMKYNMLQNDIDGAAAVAVRPLYEDEYLLAETKVEAIQVLLGYIRLHGDKWDETVRTALKKWLEDSMDAVSTGLNSERQTSVSDAFLSVLRNSLRVNESSSMSNKQKSARFSNEHYFCVTMEKF